MIWLIVQMWIALVIAFAAGAAVHRWIFGPGSGLSSEDVSAELASIRTRHQEAEAERARLRSKIMELTSELEEERRKARSAEVDVRAAELAPSAGVPGAPQPPVYEALDSPFLTTPNAGPPDDLTRIKGVGQKLAETLNEIGVFYYRQIAEWTDEQVAQVDAHLTFPGRIDRDRWRDQARELMAKAE
ncbi:MAG: hypothetical protein PVI23_08080 [Maricaulaceae bacterium]|jgi:predicted flap endonuclease-1-like 5' DNA nuclease